MSEALLQGRFFVIGAPEKAKAFWGGLSEVCMGLFGKKAKPELYAEADLDRLEAYIADTFGAFDTVLHEIASPDIHVDIAVVPPADGRDYLTLITMGMGAHRMNTPKGLKSLARAELMVFLPETWRIDSPDERDYWPIRWLKDLARLPIANDTWLCCDHTVSGDGPFADNTPLSAVMLTCAFGRDGACAPLVLVNGDRVNFWQMIPLYADELDYKMEHGADALLTLFDKAGLSPVVDIARPDCLSAQGG